MTSKQRYSILLDWWPKACRVQHWDRNDRDLRLCVISEAVKRPISTMNDLDNSKDIDAVRAHLGMLADKVSATRETLPTDQSGQRRRLYWLIRKNARPLGGNPYVVSLARDKFHLAQGLSTIEDLTTVQLKHLMMTLTARARTQARKDASLAACEEAVPAELPELVAALEDNEPF